MSKKFLFFVVIIGMITVLTVSGLATNWAISPSATWGILPPTNSSFKYGGTVSYMINDGGILPAGFNPYTSLNLDWVSWIIYQPLFFTQNSYDTPTPCLGVNYKWTDNGLKLIVKTRNGVEWSDGVPFTANDVAFTFNLLKKYPAMDLNGVWSSSTLQTVEASGTNIVVFTFSSPDQPIIPVIFESLILPEHIWSKIKDPTTWTNLNPVGTGAFVLKSYDAANGTAILVKNPNYWLKGRPYINTLIGRSYNSFDMATLELLKGDLNIAVLVVPHVYKAFVDKNPSTNKFYASPAKGFEALYFNTAKYPFSIPEFRKAIAMGMDKTFLEQVAYGRAQEVPTALGIPQSEWVDPTLTPLASSLTAYNPQKAQEMLASIGFKKNSAGQLCAPDGTPLPTYTLTVVSGYTDFSDMTDIFAKELKTLGISTNIELRTPTTWWIGREKGTYDMTFCWNYGTLEWGTSPYYIFNEMLNSEFSAPLGGNAISDYTRYTNPLIDDALNVYATTSDLRLQKQCMYTIERILLMDMPYVPVATVKGTMMLYTKGLSGFPTASDPYAGWGNTDMIALTTLSVHLE